MKLRPINYLVLFGHFFGFVVILFLDTEIHNDIFIEHKLVGAYYPILMLLGIIFYILTCQGPGFATSENEELSLQNKSWFCKNCNFCPPLRSSHCKKCGHCVLRRDHHCPFIGTCVGMENHLFFIIYLGLEIPIYWNFISQTGKIAFRGSSNIIEWIFYSFPSLITFFVGAFGIFQPILLFPFHVFLIFLNRTTWELVKSERVSYLREWQGSLSPFSHGLIHNFKEFMTMRWKHPKYSIPSDTQSLVEWKYDNSFIINDSYECC